MRKILKRNDKGRSEPPVRRFASRRAMTLMELLVVIAIMLGMAAVTIPQLQPAMETRRMREAGRSVATYFGSARTKALETGRPCGVTIEPLRNSKGIVVPGSNSCIVLRQSLVPLPFGGWSTNSVGRIQMTSYNPTSGTATFNADIPVNKKLVNPGDLIQFNLQGPFYEITSVSDDGGTPSKLSLDVSNGQLLPWPENSWSQGMKFKIYRRPVPSLAKVQQMPPMTAIDLGYSGTKSTLSAFSGQNLPITIVFSPNGSIDKMYVGDAAPTPVTEPIYLLVGQLDRAIGANPSDIPNWKDPKCMWIKLSPKTGAITSSACAARPTALESRAYADDAINTGG